MLSDKRLNIVIFVCAFLVYANTIGHEYAWDDSIVITENPRVQKGFSGIPYLFIKYNSDYRADKYGYRPITLTSFAIEYGLFKNKPGVGHLMNVLYFAILCLVLFKVLKKLFYNYTVLAPLLVTLIFIVHPIHVEVVANIKSRDEIFALLFSLLSLNQMIIFGDTGKVKHILYSSLLFILAFLSKESAIVFLAIIPLTLLYLKGWHQVKLLIKPMVAIAALVIVSACIVKLYTTSTAGASASKGAGIYHEGGILGNSFFYTDVFMSKLANAFTVLAYYLKNFFYPVNLVYFYGYNQIPIAGWDSPLVLSSLLVHLTLMLISVLCVKKNPLISYSIFFYFLSIFIYTHLFRTLADTMADRFLFTPSVGLIMLVVLLLEKALKLNFKILDPAMLISAKADNKYLPAFKYGTAGLLLLLAGLTFSRNSVWKNNEALVTHDMPYLENCARANYYYADILQGKLQKGYNTAMEADMIARYRKSIAISKESYYSFTRLASYFVQVRRYQEAINLLDTALQYYGNQADPHYCIGQAYYGAGEFKKATWHLQRSLDLAPEVSETYYYLGMALARNKEFDRALQIINTQKQKFGPSLAVSEAFGLIYFEKGEPDESAKFTLQMLDYGANPETIYGIVIGRYQLLKMDDSAAFYYKQARDRGLFQRMPQLPQ